MPLVSGQPYATLAQFFGPGGLPATALGALTTADAQDCLATSTGDMDDCLRGVYGDGFTLSASTLSLARRCVQHAKWLFMRLRGDSPETGSDQSINEDEKDFQVWIDKVQRRVIFPIDRSLIVVTAPNFSAQPAAFSLPPRGWTSQRGAD